MMEWLQAFLLTEAVEAPLYAWAGRKLPPIRRWLAALGVSAVTHPILWLGYPWETSPYYVVLLAGEGFVLCAEAALLRSAGFPKPWLWSSLANGASILAGMLVFR